MTRSRIGGAAVGLRACLLAAMLAGASWAGSLVEESGPRRPVSAPQASALTISAALDAGPGALSEPSLRDAALTSGLPASALEKLSLLSPAAEASAHAPVPPARTEVEARERLNALGQALAGVPAGTLRGPSAAAVWGRLWDGARARGQALQDALTLQRLVVEKREKLRAELGDEGLRHEMNKSAVVVETPEGEAKTTLIDGHPFERVVHKPTGLALVMLDADSISPQSTHLEQVIARQLFDGGAGHGAPPGRAPVVVWQRNGEILSSVRIARPSPFAAAWWRNYWRATYQTPDRRELKLAVVMSLVQGGLALGVEVAKALITGGAMGGVAFWAPPVFTVAFGFGVGAYLATYKNWVYRGPWYKQMAKAAVISTAFAYPVVLFTQGAAAAGLLMTHLHILYNVALNNVGGVVWRQIPRLASRHRLYADAFVFGAKKEDVVYQANYLVNWTLRLGDLLHSPGGLELFLASMPAGLLATYAFARAYKLPEAAQWSGRLRSLGAWSRSLVRRAWVQSRWWRQ